MFYVYEHWRPDRDEPFYVGKGKGRRANMMARRNQHHKAIQAKLHRLGMAVEVRLIQTNLTEQEAFELEICRIAMWAAHGIDLANKTVGGEGSTGHKGLRGPAHPSYGKPSPFRGKKMTDEQRKKLSDAKKGKQPRLGAKLSEETKEKISKANKGKLKGLKREPMAEAVKAKLSASVSKAIKGNKNPFWGKKHSEETKRKISETKKAKAQHAAC